MNYPCCESVRRIEAIPGDASTILGGECPIHGLTRWVARDQEPPGLGTIVFEDHIRAEIRVIGIGKIGFAFQSRYTKWEWVVLCEVKTRGDVRRICEAIGERMRDGLWDVIHRSQ